jgi:hypothetical protein
MKDNSNGGMEMTNVLTPKRLVNYLDRNYGYKISDVIAKDILNKCEQEFEEEFTEDELISVVEEYLN